MPGPEYMKAVTEGLGYWLKPYLLRNAVKLLSCIQLFIVTATLWICIADKSKKELHRTVICSIPLAAGIIFWFSTAPDFRFADALIFFTIIYPLFSALYKLSDKQSVVYTVAITSFLLFISPQEVCFNVKNILLSKGIEPKIARQYKEITTNRGLTVNFTPDILPDDNNRLPGYKQHINPPLPCTPYPDPDLMMQGKSLQDGFIIKRPQP